MHYPVADSFVYGKTNFSKYMPYKSQLYVIGIIAAALYLILLVVYISLQKKELVLAAADDDQQGRVKAGFSKGMQTELIAIIGILVMVIPAIVFYAFYIIPFFFCKCKGFWKNFAYYYMCTVQITHYFTTHTTREP